MAHAHGGPDTATRRLAAVLALTAGYAVAEAVGGVLSGSLALLADAGHMLGDVTALGLALFAAWSSRRPPDAARTYGYQRAEILAALANGVALIVIAGSIAFEAWERAAAPPEVRVGLMGGVALGGLAVNLVGMALLHGGSSLNQRAAYLHVLGDLLGSVGALVAAGLIWGFGWRIADPVASALIAVIIVVNAVRLVLESVHVLMEGAPPDVDVDAVRRELGALPGVSDVHDLHVWTLGGATPLLTAHLTLDHSRRAGEVLRAALDLLRERFDIEHATLQLEPSEFNISVELESSR